MNTSSRTAVDLLLTARWVLPIEPAGICLSNAGIAISGGRIVAVDAIAELLEQFAPMRQQHFEQSVLMPGLVNAHGHAAMSLLRGVAEDRSLSDWLNNHIWPLERALVTPEFVHDGMLVAAYEMIRGGTTCFADHYFYPEHTMMALDKAGLRALLANPVLDFPMPGCASGDDAINHTIELHDKVRGRNRLRCAFGPHAAYTVSNTLLKRIAVLSAELGINIHMHVHESAQEISDSLSHYGVRPLQRLLELNLLSPQFMAVHAVHVNDDDIAILAQQGVNAIHCPESNLKLANGFMPVQKLLDAGVNVALGTDGAASNNDLDMFAELRTASLLAKAVAQCPTAGKAHDMLRMATLNGAKALGMDDICGSLLPGKSADIIAVDLSAVEMQPVNDPVAHLIYNVSHSEVTDTWIEGQPVLHRRQCLTLDPEDIRARAHYWQQRIKELRT